MPIRPLSRVRPPAASPPAWEGDVDRAAPPEVFAQIPPALQPRVAAHVQHSLRRTLGVDAVAGVERMLALVGNGRFYDAVAQLDPRHAEDWREMGRVQRTFAAAEPGFDERTRAYSESMRLTLHAALIEHLADPGLRGKDDLFEAFIELHVTAFDENGAWIDNLQIGFLGALDVLGATRVSILEYTVDLTQGAFQRDAVAVRAAERVRQARRAVLAGG